MEYLDPKLLPEEDQDQKTAPQASNTHNSINQTIDDGQILLSSRQRRLHELCQCRGLRPPIFTIQSECRSGQVAWSSTCTILSGWAPTVRRTFHSRHCYSDRYADNAKEDAAEVALWALFKRFYPVARFRFSRWRSGRRLGIVRAHTRTEGLYPTYTMPVSFYERP